MSKKQSLIKGTFILTAAGLATRFIGFFYRIFLSHTFGEEMVGLYQLIFPIYILCYSLSAAGLETAISRGVAAKISLGQKKEARQLLAAGLCISIFISSIITVILQQVSLPVSISILHDARTADLLLYISYALVFACIHSCICGYYFGIRQTKIPAFSQLLEQVVRVVCVFFLFYLFTVAGKTPSVSIAVFGVIAGEIAAAVYCIHSIRNTKSAPRFTSLLHDVFSHARELSATAVPLTANRVLLTLLQSIETISIPLRLQIFGMTAGESLSIYGVLTGMALPCILFPSAITGSVSTMLLPTVAEHQAAGQTKVLKQTVSRVFSLCFLMGLICCLIFLIFGRLMGSLLFHSDLAGELICTMAWLCPFLYTNSTILTTLNGLGKATVTFAINTAGLLLRIAGIWFGIPIIGINGYLYALLASQLLICISGICCLSYGARSEA